LKLSELSPGMVYLTGSFVLIWLDILIADSLSQARYVQFVPASFNSPGHLMMIPNTNLGDIARLERM
jgi:hypothetical protein